MVERSKAGLVLREVKVKRGGKTFTQKRWIKATEDDKTEPKGKKEKPAIKGSFNVGDEINFNGKNLKIEKVSEKEQTVKINGKVYTFDAINKKSKSKKDSKIKIKSEKINIKDLTTQMGLYKSGIKFHPNGNDMITAVSDYSDTNYVTINSYLRDEKFDNKEINKEIEQISDFLKYAPKMKGTVYRGMTFGNDKDEFNKFLNECEKDKSIMMKSFTSTSTDEKVINEFSKGNYTISFEIKSKNGIYLNGLAEVPEENEVLFDKKSKFKIIKVDKSDSNHIKIIAGEI